MRIEYEVTLEDTAEAMFRVHAYSKMTNRMRRTATLWASLFGGLLVFFLLSLLDAPLQHRLIASGAGIAIIAVLVWANFYKNSKRGLLNYARQTTQHDFPITFTVELRNDCLWTKTAKTLIAFDWDNVKSMNATEECVEFRMHDGGYVLVQYKGFPTEQVRQEFINCANRYIHAAGGSIYLPDFTNH